MKNWKTTAAGAAMILGAVADVLTQLSNSSWDITRLQLDFTAAAGGVGMLFAKDHNVTGGDVRQ
jgi:hypothetical protein